MDDVEVEVALQPSDASSLATSRIDSLPPSFHYIPFFLSASESESLLSLIPPNRWVSLSHRRLQVHPSQLSQTNVLLDAPLPTWMSQESAPVLKRLNALGAFSSTKHGAPNHSLVNEYRPGEGIMPHEDGAAYDGVVATVSLGDCIVLDIYNKRSADDVDTQTDSGGDVSKPFARILQEPGSLLITTGEAYTDLLHGISPIEEDVELGPETVANWSMLKEDTRKKISENHGRHKRSTRTSLTFRDVLKVKKIGIGVVGRKA
jgi:alkylated DNA repair protein alkB homolog 6